MELKEEDVKVLEINFGKKFEKGLNGELDIFSINSKPIKAGGKNIRILKLKKGNNLGIIATVRSLDKGLISIKVNGESRPYWISVGDLYKNNQDYRALDIKKGTINLNKERLSGGVWLYYPSSKKYGIITIEEGI